MLPLQTKCHMPKVYLQRSDVTAARVKTEKIIFDFPRVFVNGFPCSENLRSSRDRRVTDSQTRDLTFVSLCTGSRQFGRLATAFYWPEHGIAIIVGKYLGLALLTLLNRADPV